MFRAVVSRHRQSIFTTYTVHSSRIAALSSSTVSPIASTARSSPKSSSDSPPSSNPRARTDVPCTAHIPSKMLHADMTINEGRSWISIIPRHVSEPPRVIARRLRLQGRYRDAHLILRQAGVPQTRSDADLIELLFVLLNTDEFTGARERLRAMADVLWNAPVRKPKKAYSILLTACAREASFVSDNSLVKRDVIIGTADTVWRELLQFESGPDRRSIALMYKICGECKELDFARRIRKQMNDPPLTPSPLAEASEEATAAFILCLGKCGKSQEAEQLYFSPAIRGQMSSDRVLSALFQAYLASNRISKAESLISMRGASFLTIHDCNAFVKQCASSRLHDTAIAFLDRMIESQDTAFPLPTTRTFNLILQGISCAAPFEETDIAAEKALELVEKMKQQGLRPTTLTYNTVIRSMVFRGQLCQALDLCISMQSPDPITFSHLMQGAANTRDVVTANRVVELLRKAKEHPNYAFCKSYLEVVAVVEGIEASFAQARALVRLFGGVVVFGDVGGEEAVRMALIHACGKAGDLRSAFQALQTPLSDESGRRGDLAPLYVATVLMQACLDCRSHGQALEVFQSLKRAGLQPNFEVYESLINGLCSFIRDSEHLGSDGLENEHSEALEGREDVLQESFGLETTSASEDKRRRPDGPSRVESFSMVQNLVREMHESGEARLSRHASYMYNTLIAAAASMGDWRLSRNVFNRMTEHSGGRVLYQADMGEGDWTGVQQVDSEGGLVDEQYDLPPATVATYNAMMVAAVRSGRGEEAVRFYERLLTDRETEPNGATMSVLASAGLECEMSGDALQCIMRVLDRSRLPASVAQKRVVLRQKLVALRWSGKEC